jgi:hypothetical protein
MSQLQMSHQSGSGDDSFSNSDMDQSGSGDDSFSDSDMDNGSPVPRGHSGMFQRPQPSQAAQAAYSTQPFQSAQAEHSTQPFQSAQAEHSAQAGPVDVFAPKPCCGQDGGKPKQGFGQMAPTGSTGKFKRIFSEDGGATEAGLKFDLFGGSHQDTRNQHQDLGMGGQTGQPGQPLGQQPGQQFKQSQTNHAFAQAGPSHQVHQAMHVATQRPPNAEQHLGAATHQKLGPQRMQPGQPNEQAQFGQPNEQAQFGQPNEQAQFGQPNEQAQFGQPNEQAQFGQPNEQAQFGQPNEQAQFGQPNEQAQFGQPNEQPQFGQPNEQAPNQAFDNDQRVQFHAPSPRTPMRTGSFDPVGDRELQDRRISSMFSQPGQPASNSQHIQAAGSAGFSHILDAKGREWEREIGQTAIHKLMHSLGDQSEPDQERVRRFKANIRTLFQVFWTRSALNYLQCAMGHPLNAALANDTFDATHVDHNQHLDAAMHRQLQYHPDTFSDLVLLTEDVMPTLVNEALSVCWQILRDVGPAGPDDMLDMFSSASVGIMQALVGFLAEALTTHMSVTERQGANADRLGRDLDAAFANFLSTCGKRVLDLMASAAVGASHMDGDSDSGPDFDDVSDFSDFGGSEFSDDEIGR